MKLTFLGATHEVTGSCTMVECGGVLGLVDCGMEQGKDCFENQSLPVSPGALDFVLLTHAHIDHSGLLPLLTKNGFRGRIYATDETTNLCAIMLKDCAHIQMQEAEWKTRKAARAGLDPVEAIYDLEDAENCLKRFRPCSLGEKISIAQGIDIRFVNAGHLLGSASIEVTVTEDGEEKVIVFSGDIGNLNQPLIRDPEYLHRADYVVMESTYGDRSHGPKPDYIAELTRVLQQTFDRGGNVVIPSFAVGRTQEMLYFIRQIKQQGLVTGHDGFPVYVDSPLGIEATHVFNENTLECADIDTIELIRKGVNPISFDDLKIASTSEESKLINDDPTPKVILSASGMCDAGRIRHHLKHNLWRPECTILFVGYQSVGTLGRSLVDGARQVKLFGETISVQAQIGKLAGISGHADDQGLLRWASAFDPKPTHVFVVHGDDQVTDLFADRLYDELGIPAHAPYNGESWSLTPLEKLCDGNEERLKKPARDVAALDAAQPSQAPAYASGKKQVKQAHKAVNRSTAYGQLLTAGEKLMDAIRSMQNRSAKEQSKLTKLIGQLLKRFG